MILINEGTIVADGSNPLLVDTGANVIANSGTIESTGSGGLIVYSDVANSGLLWADGGNLTVHGNVSGAGSAIVDAAVLDFGGAVSGSVTFQNSTGELILDHSSSFTATIYGFCGNGTLAGSDHIDLKDINFNSLQQPSYADGLLTVSDGTHTAELHFDGSYQLENFKFVDDGQNGTLLYDPPVSSGTSTAAAQSTSQLISTVNGTQQTDTTVSDIIVSSPADETLTGNGNSDSFIFKPNFGRDTITNFKLGSDIIQIDHTVFADLQHLLDATHDVNGHAVITADANNTIALDNVLKNQLLQHPSDFHFV
jgi:hypothetical protein